MIIVHLEPSPSYPSDDYGGIDDHNGVDYFGGDDYLHLEPSPSYPSEPSFC